MSTVRLKNNDSRLTKELEELKTKNPGLRELLFDLAEWVKEQFGKEIVVTMIYRTDVEQDQIYKDDPKYQKKKFKSPHQFYHSADLRSRIYTPEEIEKITNYLNKTYNDSNYYKWTAKNHTVGNGAEHFHIQWVKR